MINIDQCCRWIWRLQKKVPGLIIAVFLGRIQNWNYSKWFLLYYQGDLNPGCYLLSFNFRELKLFKTLINVIKTQISLSRIAWPIYHHAVVVYRPSHGWYYHHMVISTSIDHLIDRHMVAYEEADQWWKQLLKSFDLLSYHHQENKWLLKNKYLSIN